MQGLTLNVGTVMINKATIAAGKRPDYKEENYSSSTGFLASEMFSISKQVVNIMVDIFKCQCHSHSQNETASWSKRREVVLSLDLGVHPGEVLSTEGATHLLTSSLTFGSGPTKFQAVGSNYVQV